MLCWAGSSGRFWGVCVAAVVGFWIRAGLVAYSRRRRDLCWSTAAGRLARAVLRRCRCAEVRSASGADGVACFVIRLLFLRSYYIRAWLVVELVEHAILAA